LNDEKSQSGKGAEQAGIRASRKSRKPGLPDFKNLDYKPYVAQKDFIKTNAANARRDIVMKREAKKVIHKDGEIQEAEDFRRRSSVAKPSYHTDYGKLPAYLTKRKKELDSDYQGGNEVTSTIPKPTQEAHKESGNKEISKPYEKPRKEPQVDNDGKNITHGNSSGKGKKERRKSLPKDQRKSIHGQVKALQAPRSSITRTIERPDQPERPDNRTQERRNTLKRSFENIRRESQRRDSIRANDRPRAPSPPPRTERRDHSAPRDNDDDGVAAGRDNRRRKSRIPLSTSRAKLSADRKSSQEFHKYRVNEKTSDTTSSQRRNLEYQDLVNSGILALPFINQYGNSPILPGIAPPPGVFAFQNYDPMGMIKAHEKFQAAQIQHIQASVAKAQFEASLANRDQDGKPHEKPDGKTDNELKYQIKQGTSGTWIISQQKEQKKKAEVKYSKTPAPTEDNPHDIPYIIATNQNIYIPANYPLIQFKPDK